MEFCSNDSTSKAGSIEVAAIGGSRGGEQAA